jgi:hypothetical protein
LIGIVGVVLFMGLAIGSAVFLGPRFEEAQAQSLASNAVQAVTTIASGVTNFHMSTGYTYGAGLENAQKLVAAGTLRSVPGNPVFAANLPQIAGANGLDYTTTPTAQKATWSPKYVFMSVGNDNEVCTQTMRMLGYYGATVNYDPTNLMTPTAGGDQAIAGCFRTNTAMTNIAANDYVVFARIGSM